MLKKTIACAGGVASFYFFLCGCGGDGGGGGGDFASRLKKMDITGAKALFIAPASQPKGDRNAKAEAQDKLFKITGDGYILEVTYEDEGGNQFQEEVPALAVVNVNATYVIVSFGSGAGCIFDYSFLVRKSDGAVFSMRGSLPPDDWSGLHCPFSGFKNGEWRAYTDQDGNIYYYTYIGTIAKLNVQNPDAITNERYAPDADEVDFFVVDSGGNAAYEGHSVADPMISVRRIVKANGGLNNLPDYTTIWLGLDGNIYYQEDAWPDLMIKKIAIDALYNVSTVDYGSLGTCIGYRGLTYKLDLLDRILMVSTFLNKVFEVYNPSVTPRVIDLSSLGLSSVNVADASDSYYYLAGQNETAEPLLVKVDPTDDNSTVWLPANEYDVFKMVVSGADEVLFNALRMADGAKVIGQIDAAGTVTILDETLNTEVVVLERID